MNKVKDIVFFDFLPEPRIMLRDSSTSIHPYTIAYRGPYSYDKPVDGSQIAFFCRENYKKYFGSLTKELTTVLENKDIYGLEIPKDRSEPIVYKTAPEDLASLVNEVTRETDAKLYVIGLPPSIVNEKYYEIKARFLGENKRVQIIRDEEFFSKYIQLKKEWKNIVLHNLATAIYTKLGGTPWILSESMAEPESIIVGIGFGRIEEHYYIGTSYVKDIYGIDLDFQLIPKFGLLDIKTEGLYLPQDRLHVLMRNLIEKHEPKSIYLYKTSRFIPKEINVLKNYLDKVKLTLVYINRSKPLRAFENKSIIRRGFIAGIKIAETVNNFKKIKFFLWTTGHLIIEPKGTRYHKLGTPKGLEIEVLTTSDELNPSDEASIIDFEKKIGKQVLALTKLNWNTTAWEIREPALTTFARKAARIAAILEKLQLGASRTYDIRDFI